MSGLRIILWGLFKKVVIADRLAPIVDTVYNNISNYDAFAFIIATVNTSAIARTIAQPTIGIQRSPKSRVVKRVPKKFTRNPTE